jgi:uncharacterized protein YuzE
LAVRFPIIAFTAECMRERRNYMDAKLGFEYDQEGDILYINKCQPYAEQESEEIDYGVIARLNPDTGEIENLEILFFSKRLLDKSLFDLSIIADFRLATTA